MSGLLAGLSLVGDEARDALTVVTVFKLQELARRVTQLEARVVRKGETYVDVCEEDGILVLQPICMR